jgi:YbbR domain-containing protein
VGVLSGFLSRNWTLKLSAFGIALLLWVAVRAEAPNRQELEGVPVRVELSDPEWALVGDPTPTTVTVRFGGPSRELMRMALDRPSVVIPMDEVASGDTIVLLRNSWVRVQDRPGVIAEDIQPSSVRLVLEPVERVNLPLVMNLQGSLPGDLALSAAPVTDPLEVRVTGPRSRLQPLDSIPLQPLDLAEITSSGSIPVAVDLAGLEGFEVQPTMLRIEVMVEDRIERVVSGIPVVLPEEFEASPMIQVLPSTGTIVLSGARSVVERADPRVFRLVAEMAGAELPEPGSEATFPLHVTGIPPMLDVEVRVETAVIRNLGEVEL